MFWQQIYKYLYNFIHFIFIFTTYLYTFKCILDHQQRQHTLQQKTNLWNNNLVIENNNKVNITYIFFRDDLSETILLNRYELFKIYLSGNFALFNNKFYCNTSSLSYRRAPNDLISPPSIGHTASFSAFWKPSQRSYKPNSCTIHSYNSNCN